MKLFDRAGKPVDVPDDQAQAALTSGNYGAPVGTRIPVKLESGEIGSVPIEHLSTALAGRAQIIPQAEYEKADLQARYGDIKHQAEAFGTEALDTATLGLSNAVIGGIGGQKVRESIRKSQEANPISTGLGTAAGIIAPVVADVMTGGALTPEVAAIAGEKALARAGEKALVSGGERLAARELGTAGHAVIDPLAGLAERAVPAEKAIQFGARAAPGVPLEVGLTESVGTKAVQDVEKAIALHAPVPPEVAEAAARVAVEDAAPTVKAYGKGVIRQAVEGALLGPQRLVTGAGQAIEEGVGKIIGTEAESALGRIAQKAVAGAARGTFEGGAYGVGHEVGHQFLQDDPELSGERLASAWFNGALLGGTFGGGLGALSQGGKEALTRVVGKEGISAYLSEKAGEHMWHAAGPTQKMTEEANRYAGGTAKVGNLIRQDAEQLLGRSPTNRQEMLELAGLMKQKHGEARSAILDRLDALHPDARAGQVKLGEILSEITDVVKTAEKSALPTAPLESLKERIIKATDARNPLTGVVDESTRIPFKQLGDIRAGIDDTMAKFNTAPGADTIATAAGKEIRFRLETLLERRIDEVGDKLAEKAGGSLLKDYKTAKAGYQAGKLLEKAASRGVAKEGTNQFLSLTDKLLEIPGAMIGHSVAGPVGGLVTGIATANASKFIRRNFDFVVSDVLAKLANVSRNEHVLNAAQKSNERVQKRVDQGLNAVKKGLDGKEIPPRPIATGPQSFDERRDTLLNVAAQHQAVTEHLHNVTTPLDKAAPKVSGALMSASLRTLTYLMDALPKPPPPQPNSLTKNLDARNWEPSDQQKAQFNRKYEMAVHPEAALAVVASGQLTPQHVEALEATHPKMKADMEAKLRKELDARTKPVPPGIRPSIRLFLGVPQIDPSLGRLMQAGYAPQSAPKPLHKPLKMADNMTLNAPKF